MLESDGSLNNLRGRPGVVLNTQILGFGTGKFVKTNDNVVKSISEIILTICISLKRAKSESWSPEARLDGFYLVETGYCRMHLVFNFVTTVQISFKRTTTISQKKLFRLNEIVFV